MRLSSLVILRGCIVVLSVCESSKKLCWLFVVQSVVEAVKENTRNKH